MSVFQMPYIFTPYLPIFYRLGCGTKIDNRNAQFIVGASDYFVSKAYRRVLKVFNYSEGEGEIDGLILGLIEVLKDKLGLIDGLSEGEIEGLKDELKDGEIDELNDRLGLIDGLRDGDNDGLKEEDNERDGDILGESDGDKDGLFDGEIDGLREGDNDGDNEGLFDGERLGESEGLIEGDKLGESDGLSDGLKDGESEGDTTLILIPPLIMRFSFVSIDFSVLTISDCIAILKSILKSI